MQSKWPLVKLEDVMKHRKEFITIDDLTTYKRVTARLHAKGIVLRDYVEGSRLKIKKQQLCQTGDFLVAEIDAKVGGFGIVPEELEGAIVSSHYFLFEMDDRKLKRKYLDYFVRTHVFQKQISARGSTNYAAIRPEQVSDLEIPLPPPKMQKRIVARIERLMVKIREARKLREQAVEERRTLQRAGMLGFLKKASRCGSTKKICEVASINMGQSPPGISYNRSGDGIPLLNGPTEFGERYPIAVQWTNAPTKLCRQGNILICVRGATTGRLNWADKEYCIGRGLAALTPRKELCNPEYLYYFIETQTQQILALTAGSTFPNLPGAKLKELEIPIPPMKEQLCLVSHLDSLKTTSDQLKKLQAETETEIEELIPSILDKAFKRES